MSSGRTANAWGALNDLQIEAGEEGLAPDTAFDLGLKVAEGWQWLRNHGLIVRHPTQASSEWEALTPSADRIDEPDFLRMIYSQEVFGRLELDPGLRADVLSAFRHGSYAVAVLAAFRLVEARVREAAGLERDDITSKLMYRAFKPGGPLADPALLAGENEGRAALFAGAMAAIKNEHSHRLVDLDDPQEAAELVLFANLLLRVLERARRAAGR